MIEIRFPENVEEFESGLGLLNSSFQAKFGAFPREVPHFFLLAFFDGRVVGTINLQTQKYFTGSLEVDMFFDLKYFDQKVYPVHSNLDKVGEIGRLSSVMEVVPTYLFCAVKLLCDFLGVEFIISFNKPAIARIMESVYRFPVQSFEADIVTKNIPDEYASYFLSKNSPVVLYNYVASWDKRVSQLMAEVDDVIIDLTKINEILSLSKKMRK